MILINTLQRLEAGETIVVADVFSLDSKHVTGPKGVIGASAFISQVKQNIVTLELHYELTFLFENQFHRIDILPEDILPNRVNSLTKYGVSFDIAFAKDFARYLNFQRHLIRSTKNLPNAGWVVQDNDVHFVTKNSKELVYSGTLAITEKGTYKGWIEAINELVIGNVELELVLALALSAVMVGYDSIVLGKDIGSGIINLYGDSSSGKSTSAVLAVSCFGEPNAQREGTLMKSFSSTKNSMIKSLAGLNGILMCYDDLSAASSNDHSDLVYYIGNGKEKDRLSETSQMKSGSSFVTQVLVTGEESLEHNTKKNGGISVRYIEIDGLQYTKSSLHSEQIKRGFQKNYGFAAPLFAEYLDGLDVAELSDYFDEVTAELNEEIPNPSGKIQRYIKKISSVYVTAVLCEDCFDICLNLTGIKQLLVKNINKQALLLNYTETTLNLVISWITRKQNHFSINGLAPTNSGDMLGEINTKHGFVKISKPVFEVIVSELGLPSSQSILKEWKKMGVLKTEKDRVYYRDSMKQHYVWLETNISISGEKD